MFCEVETSNGKLNGCVLEDFLGQKYFSFHAIPYAKPPIGKLRFKDPEPIDNWNGVLNATVDNEGCYSKNIILQTITGSEDCLYLNVYTKSITPKKKLPVMFWIHGGAFTYGSNTTDMYSPDFLITQDIVLVTINYRLGVLENPKLQVTGNLAFKDMIMALKWVQSNIHYFSGDSNNVTIFGESAGAASVHLLILSKLAKGLFHKAIIQSGTALNLWAEGKRFARNLFKHLNFFGDMDDEYEILDYLQSIPVEELFQAQIKLKDSFEPKEKRCFGFILENPKSKNPFLTKHPIQIIQSGDYNHVPIVIGFTNAEGMFFELMFKKLDIFQFVTDYQNFIPYNMNLKRDSNAAKSVACKIRDFYYGLEEPSEDTIEAYNNVSFVPRCVKVTF